MRLALLCLALIATSPLAGAATVAYEQGPIQPAAGKATAAGAATGTPVSVDQVQLAAARLGDIVSLPGTAGQAVPATVKRVHRRDDGTLVWTAGVQTSAGEQTATLVVKDGHAFGWIPQARGPALRLETRHGISRILEDEEIARPAGPDVLLPPEPTPAERDLRKRQEATKAEGTPRLDVLVAYQASLVEVWGSVAAVQTRITYLETITNQAYVDTGMDLEIRVVATHLVDYPADTNNNTALYAITDSSSLAIKQEIDRVRVQYGADLVKLMRNFDRVNQTSCGVGWLGGYHGNPFVLRYGFSVTADKGFGTDGCGEWTFSHEIGHNQGAHHDFDTAGGDYGAFEYSRGYRQTLPDDTGFATIMAYSTGPQNRLGRFSTPDLSDCLGQPCGIADEADNGRGIAETAALVAGLMPEASAGAAPTLSLDDIEVTEGNSGQRTARFTLQLSAASASPVSVSLATASASATFTDYVPRNFSLLIPAGQTAVTLDVGVRGDTLVEPDEVFALNILSASGAGIAKGQGVATILSDDPVPTLSIPDFSIEEGDDGVREAVLTATLSHASNQPVRFDVETGASSASASSDFVYANLQDLEIPAGATSLQFSVSVLGDSVEESDESFYVALGGLTGARVDDSITWVRILDDDSASEPARPLLSVESRSAVEGNAGPQPADVRVFLDAAAAQNVSFSLLAQGVTATAGVDFDAAGLGSLQISAGQTEVQVPLSIIGDTLDEADETLLLHLGNVVGATPSGQAGLVTVLDDDGAAQTSPHVARDDRVVLVENAPATGIAVLANDVFATAALQGGSLVIVEQPVYGSVQVNTNGTSGTVADDSLVYTPPADAFVEDSLAYRLCDVGGRCSEGLVQVLVRPSLDIQVDSESGTGFIDVPMDGLRAWSDLRIESRGHSSAWLQQVSLAADPTPESPWDGQGTQAFHYQISYPSFPGNGDPPFRDHRDFAHVRAAPGADVDVYMGMDDNGNGRADPEETRCTAAMGDALERCEQGVRVAINDGEGAWVLVHNRGAVPVEAELHRATVIQSRPFGTDDGFVATGPGVMPAGEAFQARVSWNLPSMGLGQATIGLVALEHRGTGDLAYFPVRIDRTQDRPGAGMVRLDGRWVSRTIGAGLADEQLFLDLPQGVSSLQLSIQGGPVDVYLAQAAPDNGSAEIAPAPARAQAQHHFAGVASDTINLGAADLAPGRWYVTLVNTSGETQQLSVSATHQAQSAAIPRGSYFNPDRSGHGLFLYPAGDAIAGLWYTYFQDGTSTWYYLQATDPGTTGQWQSPLYRAAWNGSSNELTVVGEVAATVLDDGIIFSYRLDGETGSETFQPLGQGCPTLAGAQLDASSHWFDPASAGTGYSVQLFPNYEFYAAFVYDGHGVPRFLTSEAPSFLGADATVSLEQLTGFCPLCERTGAPARTDIGTLRRRFDANGLVQMELDAIYGGGVPGSWTGNDLVQPLGGPGTTQGCAVP
ncbi:reprolysin-like metallopeptidase [Arenimonas aestuarii]